MRDLVFLASWLALMPVAFMGAQYGVFLWVWTSLLAPNDMLYGLGTMVPFAKVAAALAVGVLLFRREGVRWRLGATGWILLGLAACSVLSQATTVAADPAIGWDLCQKYLKILALAMAVLWVITDRLRIHGLLFAICLGIGFIAVDEGAKFIVSGSGHKILGSASLGDNNQVALDVLLIIPLLAYLFNTAASRYLRLACVAGIGFSVVTVIASFSRGGFAGLVMVALGLTLMSRRKALGIVLLTMGLLAGTALVGSDWTARMTTMQDAQEDSSFMGRVTAWKVSTALAIERPLLGGGFHAIQHREVWLGEAHGFDQLSALVPSGLQGDFPRAAHSIYFEVLGDLGFTGLGLLLLLLAIAWRNGTAVRRGVRRSKRADLAWAADLAGKLQVSLAALMVSGGLLSTAYYDIVYLIIGLLTVLRVVVDRTLAESPERPPAVARYQYARAVKEQARAHTRLAAGPG